MSAHIREAYVQLCTALAQSIESDDQIIVGHMRVARSELKAELDAYRARVGGEIVTIDAAELATLRTKAAMHDAHVAACQANEPERSPYLCPLFHRVSHPSEVAPKPYAAADGPALLWTCPRCHGSHTVLVRDESAADEHRAPSARGSVCP